MSNSEQRFGQTHISLCAHVKLSRLALYHLLCFPSPSQQQEYFVLIELMGVGQGWARRSQKLPKTTPLSNRGGNSFVLQSMEEAVQCGHDVSGGLRELDEGATELAKARAIDVDLLHL